MLRNEAELQQRISSFMERKTSQYPGLERVQPEANIGEDRRAAAPAWRSAWLAAPATPKNIH